LVILGSLLLGMAARGETSGQQLAETVGQRLVGSPAPKLVLKTIDGETIDLGSLYGKKAVYLKFWATWCVPCRQQMPHFEHTFESAGPDLAVIAIDVGLGDSLEEIRRYQRQFGITMPIVFDEDGHVGEMDSVESMFLPHTAGGGLIGC
jgi:peroxiredoxin